MISSCKKSIKKRLNTIGMILLLYFFVSMLLVAVVHSIIFKRYGQSDKSSMPGNPAVVHFESGKNTLCGYLYNENSSDSLVVFAPGFHASCDDYILQIKSLTEDGFDVFTFNYTGTYKSEGSSFVGIPQTVRDMDAALDYIEAARPYKHVMLFGHSMGGYAACCVLAHNHNISCVVTCSATDSTMSAMTEPVFSKIGYAAYLGYPFVWLHESLIFGADEVNKSAAECLRESSVPTLVIHGKNDTQVKATEYSLISNIDDSMKNVERLMLEGGHTDILFDDDGSENTVLMSKIKEFCHKNG